MPMKWVVSGHGMAVAMPRNASPQNRAFSMIPVPHGVHIYFCGQFEASQVEKGWQIYRLLMKEQAPPGTPGHPQPSSHWLREYRQAVCE